MKSVVVVGAYGGMGKAVVRLLKKEGVRVFALDRSVENSEKNVIPIQVDVTSEESVRKAFEQVKEACDCLWAILHFAGIYMLDSLAEMDSGAFDRIFDVNLRGAFLINKTFFPLLRKGSRILMTTSELAPLDPLPFTGIYAVSKAALDKYAFSLAMELQLLGISVSVLRAGAVDTGMLDVSMEHLEAFCHKTRLYSCNAKRFKQIVEGVESRKISPTVLAKRVWKILNKRKPPFVNKINRNPLLLLLDLFPKPFQLWVIKQILR